MDIKISKIGERTSQFKQSYLNKVVIGVNGSTIYAKDGVNLIKSTDCGKTWSQPLITLPSGSFDIIHTTGKNVTLAFSRNPSKLYRSTDGSTFTEIVFNNGDWTLPFPQGVGSNGDIVFFGEWTLSERNVSRLFQSTDGGQTWSIIKTFNIPSEIRHFHSCQYFGEGIWIVTTGDYSSGYYHTDNGKSQVRWLISKDNGTTWETIENLDQRYRTLSIHLLGGTTLMWSSDAVPGKQYGAIYKAPLEDIKKIEVAYPLGKTSWGIAGGNGKYICVTSLEPGDTDNLTCAYSSTDGGNTWKIESWHRAKEGDNFVGFRFPTGLDNNGNIYVQTNSLGFIPEGANLNWRATAVFKVN